MTHARKQTDQRTQRPRTAARRLDHSSHDRSRTDSQHQLRAETGRTGSTSTERNLDAKRSGADRTSALARVGDMLASEAGTPLPHGTRREMAARFGQDFTGVRLHNGRRATETANEFDAAAYTVGDNVVLGTGVDIDTPQGQWVLAHELAHVVQNSSGGQPSELVSGGAHRPSERVASAAATGVLAGTSVQLPGRQPALVATFGDSWDELPGYMGHLANIVGSPTAGLSWVAQVADMADAGGDIASPTARLLSKSSTLGRVGKFAQGGSNVASGLGNAAGALGMGVGGYNAVMGPTAGDRYQGGADFLASGTGVFGGPVGSAFSGGYAAGQLLDSSVGALRDDGRKLSDISGDAMYDAIGPASPEFLDFYDNPLDTTTDYLSEAFDNLMDW